MFFLYISGVSYLAIVLSAILFALFGIICDACDGFVARKLKVTSKIGEELDSLADLVTFGVFPGIVAFLNEMQSENKVVFLVSLVGSCVYVLCGAYRLARYNASKGTKDEQDTFFVGLPIPAAAGVFLGILYIAELFTFPFLELIAPFILGYFMVCRMRVPHLLKRRK